MRKFCNFIYKFFIKPFLKNSVVKNAQNMLEPNVEKN